MITTTTDNYEAYILTISAVQNINLFNKTKEIAPLIQAENDLMKARLEDPDYFDAIFYSGVTMDLVGKPADSPKFFEKILLESKDPKQKLEATYNLGVAFYHQYSHRYLETAIKHFNKVLEKADGEDLKNLTLANLCQVYAMYMIPNSQMKKERGTTQGLRVIISHIQQYKGLYDNCFSKLDPFIKQDFFKLEDIPRKTAAIIENSKGMAKMYQSDYDQDKTNKKKLVSEALNHLKNSEKLMPYDWANRCDLASAYMRLGKIEMDAGDTGKDYFDKAEECLNLVLEKLRPGYGFAYYEMGRLYRIKTRPDDDEGFKDALAFYKKSMAVKEDYRDVGSALLEEEMNLAIEKNNSYP